MSEPVRILVVDDDPTLLHSTMEFLRSVGYSVRGVGTASEARQAASDERPDLILVDVVLPDGDGIALGREFKQNPALAGTLVVLHSSFRTSSKNASEALESGMDGYITRPIPNREMLARLDALVRLQRVEAELRQARAELERRVEERTAQLRQALESLEVEVAERRAAEEKALESSAKLSVLIDSLPACVSYVGADESYRFVNRQYEEWFRKDSSALVGRTLKEVLGEEIYRQAQPHIQQALAGEPAHYETSFLNALGVERAVDVRYAPQKAPDGSVLGFFALITDVSERKRLEQERFALEHRLRSAQHLESLGVLAGGIAHDFNNLLCAIVGYAELMRMDLDASHPALESLGEIKKAVGRGKNLVQQILTFSRQQPHQRSVIALGPVVEECVSLLRATLPAAVELVRSVESGTPEILADSSQMHQVLMNLCTNAWHALEDQPGRITITLDNFELQPAQAPPVAGLLPGRYARLSVIDTGKGMDASVVERIFEPFFTTKPPGRGTGLGLSVVHGIVQSHGGAISVASRPGQGTTFRLFFPAAAPPLAIARSEETDMRRGHGERILYLDDEESLLLLMHRVLSRLGYQVQSYIHPSKGLEAFRQDPDQFDMVITDLNMPEISGLQVAEEVLRLRPGMPVVLTSGFVTDELEQRSIRLGIRRVLYKPSTVSELTQAIHRVITEGIPPGKEDRT